MPAEDCFTFNFDYKRTYDEVETYTIDIKMNFGEAGTDRHKRTIPMVINYHGGGYMDWPFNFWDWPWFRTITISINRINYSESAFLHGCESRMFGLFHYEYFWILAKQPDLGERA